MHFIFNRRKPTLCREGKFNQLTEKEAEEKKHILRKAQLTEHLSNKRFTKIIKTWDQEL